MSHSVSNDGDWILPKLIYQDSKGIWVTEAYLDQEDLGYREIVDTKTWYQWVHRSCPDLDPNVNEGRIRSKRVYSPHNSGWRARIFFLNDAKTIILRRKDAKQRQTDPGGLGEWLSDDVFQLTCDVPRLKLCKGDLLFTDAKLTADSSVLKAGMSGWKRWRTHSHPSLDSSVNNGRLRWLQVPPGIETRPDQGGLLFLRKRTRRRSLNGEISNSRK
jgi:hypothetical protein